MEIRTQGDVKIFLLPSGHEIIYQSGQPVMDSGLENSVIIYLFTEKGWALNKILPVEKQIGSGFLEACRQPITIDQIREIEIEAEAALSPFDTLGFGKVIDLSVRMKTGSQIFLTLDIEKPGGDQESFELSGYAENWRMQKTA